MIYFKSDLPILGRADVWESQIVWKVITLARRDKLVTLLNTAGFVLRNGIPGIKEIIDNGGTYRIETG